jgi:hypothetical protein
MIRTITIALALVGGTEANGAVRQANDERT